MFLIVQFFQLKQQGEITSWDLYYQPQVCLVWREQNACRPPKFDLRILQVKLSVLEFLLINAMYANVTYQS